MRFDTSAPKSTVFHEVRTHLHELGFRITGYDDTRPWGGFFYIDEAQSADFIRRYFPHLEVSDFAGFAKLSPKILLVAPGTRLSWQYHFRRSEIWKLIAGAAGVVVSDTDVPGTPRRLHLGDVVELRQGERHRLLGDASEWGVVAEIWQHTDPANPSDEADIVRVQDDFGR